MPRAPQTHSSFRVEVSVRSARLLVPCGQGNCSVTWLLQQVQERLHSSRLVRWHSNGCLARALARTRVHLVLWPWH